MKKLNHFHLKTIFILLFFIKTSFLIGQEILIKNGDTWSYFDSGYLNNNWYKENNFDHWKKGVSPLGYKNHQVVTTLNYGGNPKKKEIIKYFSKTIYIKKTSEIKGYEFKLLRDDGAVIYINGKELYRDNMPNGTITNSTVAKTFMDNEGELTYFSKIFDASILKEGENTISIQIHQSSEDSSDCIFSLELIAHKDSSILVDVVNEQLETKDALETKIDLLNYSFLLKNTITELEVYKKSNDSLRFLLFLVCFLLIITIIGVFLIFFRNKKNEVEFKSTIENITANNIEKEKQMITSSAQLLYNKQYLKEIKADLNFINKDKNKALQNIIKQIDSIIENESEWDQLKLHFDAVFTGFYDKLHSKFPALTETELRHCMFIKLHMQTKEIARILNIDPRSVQTARYRIKKKFDLEENQDLRSFLIGI